MQYKKFHQLFLKNAPFQINQRLQEKTFDRIQLMSLTMSVVRFQEYESFRRILSRKLSRFLRVSLISKPYSAVSAKPREIRMGKGKGAFSHYVLPVSIGTIIMQSFWCHSVPNVLLFHNLKNALKKSHQLAAI